MLAGLAATIFAFAVEGRAGSATRTAGAVTVAAVVAALVVPAVYGRSADGLPRFSTDVRIALPIMLAAAIGVGAAAFADDAADPFAPFSAPSAEADDRDDHNGQDGHSDVAGAEEHGHEGDAQAQDAQAHDEKNHRRRVHRGRSHGSAPQAGHIEGGSAHGAGAGLGHGHTGATPGGGGDGDPAAPVVGKWNTVPDPGASSRCANGGPFGGDHSHGSTHPVPLDAETQARVDAELDAAQAYALQFPTPAAAEAAGYRRLTPYDIPCIGDHYIRWNITNGDWGIVDGHFDPAQPEMILYWGGQVVGVSYLVVGSTPPAGFSSDNDGWHVHPGMCLTDGIIWAAPPTPAEFCQAPNQIWLEATNLWMGHAWVVPGWESDLGAFSDGNNRL